MRKQMIALAGTLTVLCACGPAFAQTSLTSDVIKARARYSERKAVEATTKPLAGGLTGLWTAPVYQVPLNSDLDISVWGRHASYRRDVDLAIEPSGEGVLTVRTAVVDRRGRTKPGSLSIEEARIRVAVPDQTQEGMMQPSVTVLSAERRYPDDPSYRWPLEGLVVKVSTVASDANRINMRFDTAEGRGSFGESLIRQRPRAAGDAAR